MGRLGPSPRSDVAAWPSLYRRTSLSTARTSLSRWRRSRKRASRLASASFGSNDAAARSYPSASRSCLRRASMAASATRTPSMPGSSSGAEPLSVCDARRRARASASPTMTIFVRPRRRRPVKASRGSRLAPSASFESAESAENDVETSSETSSSEKRSTRGSAVASESSEAMDSSDCAPAAPSVPSTPVPPGSALSPSSTASCAEHNHLEPAAAATVGSAVHRRAPGPAPPRRDSSTRAARRSATENNGIAPMSARQGRHRRRTRTARGHPGGTARSSPTCPDAAATVARANPRDPAETAREPLPADGEP